MMSTSDSMQLEVVGGHCYGHLPEFPLRFNFTEHFRRRLKERWGRDVAEVLVSIREGWVIASNSRSYYAVELTRGVLGNHRMLLVLAHPDHHDFNSVALVTVYPEWDGKVGTRHVETLRRQGMRLTRRRPVLEVLTERPAA